MSTQRQRDKRYADAMRKKGFRKVALWVHDDDRKAVRDYSELLKRARLDD